MQPVVSGNSSTSRSEGGGGEEGIQREERGRLEQAPLIKILQNKEETPPSTVSPADKPLTVLSPGICTWDSFQGQISSQTRA